MGTVDVVANTGENASAVKVKGIPNFWLTAMKNSNLLSGFIEEHDEPVLKFLENITVTILPNFDGFQINFYFTENNPYFTNKVLSKTVFINGYIGEEEDEEEATTTAAEGTTATEGGAKSTTDADKDEEDEEEDDDEEGDDDDESFDGVQKIEGTEINWKPGKNVTVTYVLKKKGKGKNARTVREEEEVPSFFRFFEPTDFHYEGGNDMQAVSTTTTTEY